MFVRPVLFPLPIKHRDAHAIVFVPASEPKRSQPLSPNLIGLSIEMDRWEVWAGNQIGKPNTYVNKMLQNLGEKTGSMPCIRVGANSQDHGVIRPDVQVIEADFGPVSELVPFPEASVVGIGRDFYAMSSNLPNGTRFIWGLNLKYNDVKETAAQAALLAETFLGSRKYLTKDVKLEYVQIGNEASRPDPDFFYPNPKVYVAQWQQAVSAVKDILHLGTPDGPKLQGPALAGIKPCEWSLDAIFDQGYLAADGGLLKNVSVHHYFGARTGRPTSQASKGDLMNKLTIRLLMSRFHRDIQRCEEESLEIMVGETNTYGLHGIPGVSNTGEAAIWMVDYALHCASLGLGRLHFHHGVGFDYNLIQPIAGVDDGTGKSDRPHVLPAYYGAIVINEAIGSTGRSRVSEVACNRPNVSSFAIWENAKLVRLVIINSTPFLVGTVDQRPAERVQLDGLPHGGIKIKRLTMPYTDVGEGIEWAGTNYDAASGDNSGQEEYESLLGGGWMYLPASEVAILYL